MNRVLFINIDALHRSAYSALMAQVLRTKDPRVRISLICSVGGDFLAPTGLFDEILQIDPQEFFSLSRTMDDEKLEREMARIVTPLSDREWTTVINFSTNDLGAYLTYFFNYKEVLGSFYKNEKENILFSGLAAYLTFNLGESGTPFRHVSKLYLDIMERYGDSKFEKVAVTSQIGELQHRMTSLKKQAGKGDIVLIDTGILRSGIQHAHQFLIFVFKALRQKTGLLPVLLSSDAAEDSFVIQSLRDSVQGEIHVLSADSKNMLGLIDQSSLVLTDNLLLKSLADLSSVKSVFLTYGTSMAFGDFSMTEGSVIQMCRSFGEFLGEQVVDLIHSAILPSIPTPKQSGAGGYRSFLFDSLPLLAPIADSEETYLVSWMKSRYLSYVQAADHAELVQDPTLYAKLLIREKKAINASREVSASPPETELLRLSALLYNFKGRKQPSDPTLQVLKFLDQELIGLKPKLLK